ncbi:uncharacterized protein LOC117895373 [Drosophila subobscura]|uniref:uncharacterized protein LOC117895373 n=1 Tax=Drosophila subobscura TaxID=7241 RepID=UPI00155ACBCF|nr:uncharacterized protein LOC117895373 [Drosophila subobscura]XP_034658852.1 uncharacterized protein LOC117895373 [Drosophila subobscura]
MNYSATSLYSVATIYSTCSRFHTCSSTSVCIPQQHTGQVIRQRFGHSYAARADLNYSQAY